MNLTPVPLPRVSRVRIETEHWVPWLDFSMSFPPHVDFGNLVRVAESQSRPVAPRRTGSNEHAFMEDREGSLEDLRQRVPRVRLIAEGSHDRKSVAVKPPEAPHARDRRAPGLECDARREPSPRIPHSSHRLLHPEGP